MACNHLATHIMHDIYNFAYIYNVYIYVLFTALFIYAKKTYASQILIRSLPVSLSIYQFFPG